MIQQTDFVKLLPGDPILHYCILAKQEIKSAKNGRSYFQAEVKDKTALLIARKWDEFEDFFNKAKDGDLIKIQGVTEEYQGVINIKIEKIRLADPKDNLSLSDFMQTSQRSLNEMKDELNSVLESLKNQFLKMLAQKIFTGENLEKYTHVPAGKSWHHSYISGLLEHTLEIVKICDLTSTFHKEVKRDLLICGALFHDYGKIRELSINANFDYTDEGRLLGHIVMGAMEIEKAISEIPNFPQNLKTELLHLILSHQGKLEFATPVEPKTLEAIILYHADELSAKANAYKNAIKSEENKPGNWTKFIPLANTALYKSVNDFI